MISVFDIFKIGIGPSSSHTVGPMRAAGRFVKSLRAQGHFGETSRVETRLYGSLAWTGHGHATDTAVILGLAGEEPETTDPEATAAIIARAEGERSLALGGHRRIGFSRDLDIIFDRKTPAKGHPNTLSFTALDANGVELLTEFYFSIGGGFVLAEVVPTRSPPSILVARPTPSG